MRLVIARAIAALTILIAGLVTFASPAQAIDKDCGDFATQAAAQTFFNNAGPGDPHNLDSEGDGRACESNPCPCLTGGGNQPQPVPLAGNTNGSGNPAGGSDSHTVVHRNVGNVVKVTDGDTLKVRINGIGIRDIRILGIDTPEKYGQRECGAVLATESMEQLAPVGSRVVLTSDHSQAEKDRYGRLLRYVERSGRDVGRAQIFTGHSKVYVYGHDPVRRTANYRRVEGDAHRHNRGLWATCWN